jgi:hypothetical protein
MPGGRAAATGAQTRRTMMAQEQGSGDFSWQVQVGPGLQGNVGGAVYGTSANFLFSPGGSGQAEAAYSTDQGATWTPFPLNQSVPVSGGDPIQWQVDVQPGGDAKFLIGGIGG